jgi:hypothetical protein
MVDRIAWATTAIIFFILVAIILSGVLPIALTLFGR